MVVVRRLGPGDEEVVRRLSLDDARYEEDGVPPRERPPHTPGGARRFLDDDTRHLLVAFDGEDAIGHVLAYELERRHGDGTLLFVYEVGVARDRRREGVGRLLFESLFHLASERGLRRAFVLTNERNGPAMAFYRALGGTLADPDDVMFRFELSGS